jgi:hypothetical protein
LERKQHRHKERFVSLHERDCLAWKGNNTAKKAKRRDCVRDCTLNLKGNNNTTRKGINIYLERKQHRHKERSVSLHERDCLAWKGNNTTKKGNKT